MPRSWRRPCNVREGRAVERVTILFQGTRLARKGVPLKALTWHGKNDMRCESVPDPKIEHPRDAIIKVTACAICGSDLHIFNGVIPG
ncbi:MAG: glutathione-dependent formaldehyde dehydrogenase, partial [Reyranella sp.]